MSKTIERALSTAVTVYEDVSHREDLLNEAERLVEMRKTLLPVEEASRRELEQRVDVLLREAHRLEIAETLDKPAVLDPIVFSWTNTVPGWKADGKGPFNFKQGRWVEIEVPALAYIPLSRSDLTLATDSWGHVEVNGWRSTERSFPPAVYDHYFETMQSIRALDRERAVTLTYTYSGVLPDNVRQIVRDETRTDDYGKSRLKRFDELALVCDASKWDIQTQKAPPPPPPAVWDPILVGILKGDFWILATFDPTPLEQYIASEFSS